MTPAAWIAKARPMLRLMEWSDDGLCPGCSAERLVGAHYPDCGLAALLADAPEDTPDAWELFSHYRAMAGPWAPSPDGFMRKRAGGGVAAEVYEIDGGFGYSADGAESTGATSIEQAKAWADDSLRGRRWLVDDAEAPPAVPGGESPYIRDGAMTRGDLLIHTHAKLIETLRGCAERYGDALPDLLAAAEAIDARRFTHTSYPGGGADFWMDGPDFVAQAHGYNIGEAAKALREEAERAKERA